jgi:hypothetical protein
MRGVNGAPAVHRLWITLWEVTAVEFGAQRYCVDSTKPVISIPRPTNR